MSPEILRDVEPPEESVAIDRDVLNVAGLAVADQLDEGPAIQLVTEPIANSTLDTVIEPTGIVETSTEPASTDQSNPTEFIDESLPKNPQTRKRKPTSETDGRPIEQRLLSIYLKEAAETPALTPETEIALAQQMEAGKAAAAKLEAEGHKLTAEEVQKLEKVREYGQVARINFILANLKLVASISKHFMGQGLERLDLIQEGSFGLFKAVDNFKWDKGKRFSTYATYWIVQAMQRGIIYKGKPFRFPSEIVEEVKSYKQRWYDMKETLGRKPTIAEVAKEMKVDVDKLQEKVNIYDSSTLSLDSARSDDGKVRLSNNLTDQVSVDIFEAADNVHLKPLLVEILTEVLDYREIEVLIQRLDLDGQGVRTLEEIGKQFNVNKESVRKIQAKAISKLKNSTIISRLSDYEP